MRVPFLDLPAQHQEVQAQLEPDILEILRSGQFVLGKWNKKLEETLASQHSVRHGIAVNSATDALRILMQACGIGPGDEVITTAFTFVSSVEVIAQLGATPVFADIDPATFNLDPASAERCLSPRTKAILPIHLFGQLADMGRINALAERHGLILLEDAAQAVLATQNGRASGGFGKGAGISFYVTKNLGAAGDGGLILTDDPEIDARSRSLRIHGMGRQRYYYDDFGYTSRMAELQACVLVHKLERLPAWNQRRSELAQIYLAELQGAGCALPETLPGNEHVWHQFTVRHPKRDALMAHLKERGIDSGIYYPIPIHLHTPYQAFGHGPGSLPVTERAAAEVLSLPIHPHLSDDQVRHVATAIREFAPAVTPGH